MFLAIYYMFATAVQWWRLGHLKNKLYGTINSHNALVVCTGNTISDLKNKRCLENLLFHNEDRIACTVVPKQKVDLSQWVLFPKNLNFFPIHIHDANTKINTPRMYLLVQTNLNDYSPHQSEVIQVENFGELVAWRATDNFELVLKTDMDHLTRFINAFADHGLDINHELQVIKIETVDVENNPLRIKYDTKYPLEYKTKYSLAPVHWKKFAQEVKGIYSKIHELEGKKMLENPTITIEVSNKPEETKKVPVSEVKPIKKEHHRRSIEPAKRHEKEMKNKLEVSSGDTKRVKSSDRKVKSEKAEEEEQKTSTEPSKKPREHRRKEHTSKLKTKENDAAKSAGSEVEHKKSDHVVENDHRQTKEHQGEHHKTEEHKSEHKTKEGQDAHKSREHHSEHHKTKEHLREHKTKDRQSEHHETKEHKSEHKTKEGQDARKSREHHSEHHKTKEHLSEHKTKEHLEGHKTKEHLGEHKTKEHLEDHKTKEHLGEHKTREHLEDHKTKEHLGEHKTKEHQSVHKTKEPRPKLKDIYKSRRSENDGTRTESDEVENAPIVDEKKMSMANGAVKCATTSDNHCQKSEPKSTNETRATGSSSNTKPTNVLVYADSLEAKDNVKEVLHTILNIHKYTVYDFPVTGTNNEYWNDSTNLIVVCGSVPANLTSQLLQYLVTGGKLLCLCSDLLYSVLHTFTTAEVRERELVRFSYGDWKRVKMMHHVFCYQASPAKKQFSKDSDQSSHSNGSRGSSPVAPRTPSAVEIQHNNNKYVIQVQVLGTEETWQTPSLLLASVKNSKGQAIFSQVHLEIDPNQYQDDENKYAALKESNQARLQILKHILSNHLNMDCTNSLCVADYSPAYFLGRHDLKQRVLSECDCIVDNKLISDKITLKFCGKGVEPEAASASHLPILIHACPANFSTVLYFETLQTQAFGRLVIYADVLTSSQLLLSKTLWHGIVVIPQQQTQGAGRSGNSWLSPLGCAMFSLQLHIPLDSPLGKSLPLIQHLVMVAIVSAIKSLPGYEEIDIGIKWPNDLYAYSFAKIGGLVVNSTCYSDKAIVNIGCGVNLNNKEPTTCLNEIIKKYNDQNRVALAEIPYEKFFALVLNELESLYNVVQSGDVDLFFDLYYEYWLHTGAEITVNTNDSQSRKVTIIGIDDFGFLKVRAADGSISNVQPDGNSFDMLKGLIAPKIF